MEECIERVKRLQVIFFMSSKIEYTVLYIAPRKTSHSQYAVVTDYILYET